ncbi:MAG: VapC toxin family PIN domain ribonuclease [Aquificaceae bacterium]|nr:MAG: VapC toxin family PIN domain ribonuclease [Aquificaceae bacterium]
MEIIKSPIYFDTNVFIYSIDGYEEYYDVLANLFQIIAENDLLVITSELTLAECLVKPMKDGNEEAIKQFTAHIKTSDTLKVKPVSRKILIRSAKVRHQLSLKLPDAIHMATAIEQQCKTFITNDRKLCAPNNMQRVYLKDLLG